MDMPVYVSRHEVRALRIQNVQHGSDGNMTLYFFDTRYPALTLKAAASRDHRPNDGDYAVFYADDSIYYVGAAAFEEGYALKADGGSSYNQYWDTGFAQEGDPYGIHAEYVAQSASPDAVPTQAQADAVAAQADAEEKARMAEGDAEHSAETH